MRCQPFFELLGKETDPGMRVVLGHFVFVYIHPYMDGNGRMGRFLMNLMMAAGGYPRTEFLCRNARLTCKPSKNRASARISRLFADFLAGPVKLGLARAPLPAVPKSGEGTHG
jgi:Fic/DOC family